MESLYRELALLETKCNKLFYRANKQPFDVAAKDWKKYRKVHARLCVVKKTLSQSYSPHVFSRKGGYKE